MYGQKIESLKQDKIRLVRQLLDKKLSNEKIGRIALELIGVCVKLEILTMEN